MALIVPMLFIIIGSFGYASLNNTVYTIASLESADYHIEIAAYRIEFYNGLHYQIFCDNTRLSFNDSGIFPGWELIINITIRNMPDSWVCKLNYTISYLNKTTNQWIITNPATLLNLFKIEYESQFYNSTGDIIIGEPELFINESVYKIEHLKFVATPEEFENLLFEELQIKIEIFPNHPDPPTDGGE